MSFDRLAPVYRPMEAILAGTLLQRCRTAFLSKAIPARSVLLVGEGPGRFLEALLRINSACHVTCVDSSTAMLRLAQAASLAQTRSSRLCLVHSDVRDWTPTPHQFDLVATHFVLDCFPETDLGSVIDRIAGSATSDATWLLSDFRIPERGWHRTRARAIHALMYAFFRAATGIRARAVTPPDPFLLRAGFRLHGRRILNAGLVHGDLWCRQGGPKTAPAPIPGPQFDAPASSSLPNTSPHSPCMPMLPGQTRRNAPSWVMPFPSRSLA